MDRAETYKKRLDALGSMFEFEVAEIPHYFESQGYSEFRTKLMVRAVLRLKDTELTLVYATQDTDRLGPEVLLELFADGVKHALMNPRAQCYMLSENWAPLKYTLKEVMDGSSDC